MNGGGDGTEGRSVGWAGLLAGGIAFLALLLLPGPGDLSAEGWRTAAVAVLMAVWWMTEAIPIPATAIVPLVAFPFLGILEMPDAASPYAHPLIFLFMGGFLLAYAMERWNLHKRIALAIVAYTGTSSERLVLGFMLATASLSMWISNTATAAMMLPIGIAVGEIFRPSGALPTDADPAPRYDFGIALMLGIAYGASIGGVATIIGTPPNAVLVGAMDELLDVQIGFLEWMAVGLPMTVLLLPVAWLLLVKVLYPPGEISGDAAGVIEEERRGLGPVSTGEKVVGAVFLLAALGWVFRAPKEIGPLSLPGIQSFAPAVDDATIAMGAALLLFLIPVDRREGRFAMDWETARRIPWGILVLFGGGLSLARGMDRSGLAEWIGGGVGALENLPAVAVVGAAAVLFVFLTEMTSNVATCTMAMPIMAGVAAGIGFSPITLMTTAALASSMAFMLPVATPPNAIVFGSEYLTIPVMARSGFWMNWIAISAITAAATLMIPHLLS